MKEERIMEEMAKLDGLTCEIEFISHPSDKYPPSERLIWTDSNGQKSYNMPRYLRSHDAVQRVIDGLGNGNTSGMSRKEASEEYSFSAYAHELWVVCGGGIDSDFLKATPCQKCEAILRAVGAWED